MQYGWTWFYPKHQPIREIQVVGGLSKKFFCDPTILTCFFGCTVSRQNAKETPWHRSVPGGTQYRYRSHRSSYQPVLHNEVLGITKDFLQPGQNYNKMYGTEPRCNEPRFNNEILVITNAIQKRKSKIYFDGYNEEMSTSDQRWMRNRPQGQNLCVQ